MRLLFGASGLGVQTVPLSYKDHEINYICQGIVKGARRNWIFVGCPRKIASRLCLKKQYEVIKDI